MYGNLANFRPLPFYSGGANYALSYALDTSTKKWAIPFIWPSTFTLAKVSFFLDKAGTSPTYAVRVETDDGTGQPSGTLAWANASGTFTVPTNAFISEVSLTAAGAGTVGSMYHLVIQYSSGTVDGSNFVYCMENGQLAPADALAAPGLAIRVARRYNGTSWSAGSGVGGFVLVDNGGTPTRWGQVLVSATLPFLSNTDWYGVKFAAPANCSVFAAGSSFLTSSSAGTVSAKLIDNTNTVLGSADTPAGWWDLGGRQHHLSFYFPTPISLTKGATYRLVWKDTAGAARLDMPQTVSTYKTLTPDGGNSYMTNGTSADGTASPTAWTDTDTNFPDWSLLVNDFPAGGSGVPMSRVLLGM